MDPIVSSNYPLENQNKKLPEVGTSPIKGRRISRASEKNLPSTQAKGIAKQALEKESVSKKESDKHAIVPLKSNLPNQSLPGRVSNFFHSLFKQNEEQEPKRDKINKMTRQKPQVVLTDKEIIEKFPAARALSEQIIASKKSMNPEIKQMVEAAKGYLNAIATGKTAYLNQSDLNKELGDFASEIKNKLLKDVNIHSERLLFGKGISNLEPKELMAVQRFSQLAKDQDLSTLSEMYRSVPIFRLAVKAFREGVEEKGLQNLEVQDQLLRLFNLGNFLKTELGLEKSDSSLERQEKMQRGKDLNVGRIANSRVFSFIKKGQNEALLKKEISREITNQKQEKVPLERLKDRRSNSPVKARVISSQSEVFLSSRLAKKAALRPSNVSKPGNVSVNEVYRLSLKDKDISQEKQVEQSPKAAFFKSGRTATIEEMIWQSAIALGIDEAFVATKGTSLQVREHHKQGGIQTGQEGMLVSGALEVEKKRASLVEEYDKVSKLPETKKHAAKKKNLLEQIRALPAPLSKDQLSLPVLASCVLGTYDLHVENGFVTQEGKVKFFDNARSFPPTNLLKWANQHTMPAYRPGLLTFAAATERLTQAQKNTLKESLIETKQKMKDLEAYYESDVGKSKLLEIPDGWLDTKSSMEAMKKRVDGMLNALENNKVETLEDLSFAAVPEFKVFMLLTMKRICSEKMIEELASGKISAQEVNKALIFKLATNSITYETLYPSYKDGASMNEIAKFAHLPIDEALKATAKYLHDFAKHPPDYDTRYVNKKFMQMIESQSKADMKDTH